MSAAHVFTASTDIKIGEHTTFSWLGMTFNSDTIYSTLIAGAVVIVFGLVIARGASVKHPSKPQLIWESLVGWVTEQVESNLGRVNPFVIPLAITLFAFILIANWLELIPTDDWLKSPTSDVNLTYALALLVIVGVHIYSVRQRGVKGYVHHYFEPYKALFPILLIEEIVKPFTLALRLFGNIFSGGIMLAIIGLLPTWILWGPNGVWKLFDLFIGLIQAFIFALLTILYFGMAGDTHDDEAHASSPHDAVDTSGTESAVSMESQARGPQVEAAH
ncbi:MAG: F-type H+-transporting ATPase subunit a [Nocardioidaceae bacterium]|jgi:F-type H+-transporting ATPase subunit a|nr:F-type H+-transporting ATPase subunit a [Nocardioidaceae bacterium]